MRFWRGALAWALAWIPDGLSRLMLAIARSEARKRAQDAADERSKALPRDGPA